MKRIFIVGFLCFCSAFFYSQKIILDWKGSTSVEYGTEKKTIPFFTNAGYHFDSENVYFNFIKKDSDKKLKAQNLLWEKISVKDLFSVNTDQLPDHEDISADVYFNKYDQTNTSSLKIATLKFEKNEVFRLLSFEIVPDNSTAKRTASSPTGTSENPLKSGTFYKIKVDKSGVFKITTEFLRTNGINISGINPKNFRIYGNGGFMLPEYNKDFRFPALQQNAIQVVGEDDGVWNDGDYALFYAQGPNGYNLYDTANGDGNKRTETRTDRPNNVMNIYDDFSYYFINFDIGAGKRIIDIDTPLEGESFVRYDDYQVLNEEKYNLMKLGRVWVGDAFTDTKEVIFNLPTPLLPGEPVRYRASVGAYEGQGNKITFSINDTNLQSGSSQSEYRMITYIGNSKALSGNQLKFILSPDISTNPNGRFYLDYAEVQYRQDLKYNGRQLPFREYSIMEGSGVSYSFTINNTSGLEQVWDVSDITNVSRKTNKNSNGNMFSFGYQANSSTFNNEFVAFNQASAYTPIFVGRITNSDLSELKDIEYIMITSTEMMTQAQRLAHYYRNTYKVAVADINQIYNEFSSGRKDVTAIRDFVTRLNSSGTLKYIFILGDSSYDYRGHTSPGSDIIPAYQSELSTSLEASYVTDDFYGRTTENQTTSITSQLPNIPVGRLPAANISEAKLLIDKTLAYYNALPGQPSPFGEWRLKLDFVVDDDEDENGLPFHTTVNNAIHTTFENEDRIRSEYNVRKLYLDAFPPEISAGGQRFPQINQAISNDMSNSLYMFYFGHGGVNGWAQERVLTTDEIHKFNNYNRLYSRFPLVSTITCEFTLWDNPDVSSAGEQVIKSREGGAATMITSSRQIAINYGVAMTNNLTKRLFELTNDQFGTLGDSFLKAKADLGNNSNHLRVNFLGDPAMKLSRPENLIQINEVKTPEENKMRALDFVRIKGQINQNGGAKDETFNGKIVINIFDKKQKKETRNNDGNSHFAKKLIYDEEGAPIVKSAGIVKNGEFTVEFYVPKDINYEYGDGRILAYAHNQVFDVFESKPFPVGGINPDGIKDNLPPNVNLYMNNIHFVNGGITDQNPTLLACVTDDTGINSTGAGVGHDITAYLDGEIINTVVLNDFYSAGESGGCMNPALSEYQKGVVTYPFRNLKPGEHQLTFKIWDINNNSRTETLHFIVKDEADKNLTLNRLLNWPNPFTNKTYIQFEHNCDDILTVNVQIYTIAGKLVRNLSTSISAEPFMEGYRTPRTAIEWDGRDDFGDVVGKGTYIFKVYAKAQNQEKCRGSATAVEKMVLLK